MRGAGLVSSGMLIAGSEPVVDSLIMELPPGELTVVGLLKTAVNTRMKVATDTILSADFNDCLPTCNMVADGYYEYMPKITVGRNSHS
jgi:hypothetical protein